MAISVCDSCIDVARIGFPKSGRDQQYLRFEQRDVDGWGEGAVGVHAAFEYPEEVAGRCLLCRFCYCVSHHTFAHFLKKRGRKEKKKKKTNQHKRDRKLTKKIAASFTSPSSPSPAALDSYGLRPRPSSQPSSTSRPLSPSNLPTKTKNPPRPPPPPPVNGVSPSPHHHYPESKSQNSKHHISLHQYFSLESSISLFIAQKSPR